MSMLVPIVLVVGTKYCLQTTMAMLFIAVPSFMCVNCLLVHGKQYLYNTLAPFPFCFDVVCIQVHCLPIDQCLQKNCQNIVNC